MSQHKHNNVAIVILAAGDGTRMKSDLPKVMHDLGGKPLIAHAVENAIASQVTEKPVVVVSPKHTLVQDFLGDRAWYVVQAERRGTGHAAGMAQPVLEGKAEHVIVLYGDMPFLTPTSIAHLAETHCTEGNMVTMMTVQATFEHGAASPLYDFGRIIRNEAGEIIDSVELKDATAEQAALTEVNPCYYAFQASWLWAHVVKLTANNAQGEYYLTDLVKMAIQEKGKLGSIDVDPQEATGINSPEDLARALKHII